jgi:hypothetical protein
MWGSLAATHSAFYAILSCEAWRASYLAKERALDDAGDQGLVRESSLRCGRRVFGIRRKIRIRIYIDDEGGAGRIHTKIDASIATEPEQDPAGQRELLERLGQFGLVLLKTEAAQRADIGGAVGRPFAVVTVNLGRVDL